jgi:transcriptional regulator with XRE-family HTH domain
MYNDDDMKKTAAADFMHTSFLEWQLASRRKQTLRAFAEYLDVAVTSLSGWMTGGTIPSGENLEKIASKCGPGIYDALGLPRPDPDIEHVKQAMVELTPEQRAELRQFVEDWLIANGYRRIK